MQAMESCLMHYAPCWARPEHGRRRHRQGLPPDGGRHAPDGPRPQVVPQRQQHHPHDHGTVGSYEPGDAMFYDYVTTADGILEKGGQHNPSSWCPSSSTTC